MKPLPFETDEEVVKAPEATAQHCDMNANMLERDARGMEDQCVGPASERLQPEAGQIMELTFTIDDREYSVSCNSAGDITRVISWGVAPIALCRGKPSSSNLLTVADPDRRSFIFGSA